MYNLFSEFLDREGVHNQFFKNAPPDFYEISHPSTSDFVHIFDWGESPEGFDFWLEINDKWRKICRGHTL